MLENKKQFIQKLNKLASSLNITYKNVDYYFEAFSHPSFGNENKSGLNYERLEFLGDAILDFLVGEYLYKNYKDLQEGAMSKLRAEYVCEQANSKYTQEMHLDLPEFPDHAFSPQHCGRQSSFRPRSFRPGRPFPRRR